MSHFTVLVVGSNPEDQLAPFDENLEVPKYVEYTREQLIEKARKEIQEYDIQTYQHFKKDPEKYKARCAGNPGHIKYLEEEFPLKLKFNEEQLYEEATKYYEKSDLGLNGEVYSTCNPKAKWDWYSLGGRWAGKFLLKKERFGKQGHHRAKDFDPSVADLPENRVDQAYKKDIDFESMENEAAEKAAKEYDKVMEIFGDAPKLKTWNEYLKDRDAGLIEIDEAREAYHNQTRIKLAEKFCENNKIEFNELFGDFFVEYDVYNLDRDAFIEMRKVQEISTFAVLMNNQWYERGSMGWWGAVSDEQDQVTWNLEFKKLLDSIPDDTLLSVYDCHI